MIISCMAQNCLRDVFDNVDELKQIFTAQKFIYICDKSEQIKI